MTTKEAGMESFHDKTKRNHSHRKNGGENKWMKTPPPLKKVRRYKTTRAAGSPQTLFATSIGNAAELRRQFVRFLANAYYTTIGDDGSKRKTTMNHCHSRAGGNGGKLNITDADLQQFFQFAHGILTGGENDQ